MNGFQVIGIVLCTAFLALTLAGAGRGPKLASFGWGVLWLLGAAAVAWPESTVYVARALGIGRGADVLLYFGLLLTPIGFFLVFARLRRQDRMITALARELALRSACLPSDAADKGATDQNSGGAAPPT